MEGNACLDLYEKAKPLVVISHEAPKSVNKSLFAIENDSSTARLLEEMLTIHKPNVWVFGHHHISKREQIDDTLFICLAELELVTINV
jgi:Icc-related predicted phosphoesterase